MFLKDRAPLLFSIVKFGIFQVLVHLPTDSIPKTHKKDYKFTTNIIFLLVEIYYNLFSETKKKETKK